MEALLANVDYVFTTRDVVVETFNALQRRTRSTPVALAWWSALSSGRTKIFEPPLPDLQAWMGRHAAEAHLSLVDASLAFVARRDGVKDIATEDNEFRRVNLHPVFAHA